jgi:hypothetical protein
LGFVLASLVQTAAENCINESISLVKEWCDRQQQRWHGTEVSH